MMGLITLIMLWTTCSTPQYTTAQQPAYAFRSTSQMLPATPTYQREYADPFSNSGVPKGRIRRGLDPEDEGENPGYTPGDPGIDPTTPIGDVPWVFIGLLAAGYTAYHFKRKRAER